MTAGRSQKESWNCIPGLFLYLYVEVIIMTTIQYADVNQQIEKLKSRNLTFKNIDYARKYLELYGYSNLIKSYRDPYVIEENGKKIFRDGVSFEQVCSLYIFDKNLRIAVMAAMLDLEEYFKEVTANVVAQSFGTHQDQYLEYRNYQNKRKTKYRFSLPEILDTLKKTLDTDKEPIHHYIEKYGTVPPWILFKSVYFSTIVNYIDQLKACERRKMVQRIYNLDSISEDNQLQLMMDTLFIALEYRNMAAHGGRIYNYQCKRELSDAGKSITSLNGFSLLLRLLDLMDYRAPYSYLDSTLTRELNRHCKLFPQDTVYLEQILNLKITLHDIVWITDKSKIYHATQHCSGMKKAREIDLKQAQSLGYSKCCKCC